MRRERIELRGPFTTGRVKYLFRHGHFKFSAGKSTPAIGALGFGFDPLRTGGRGKCERGLSKFRLVP